MKWNVLLVGVVLVLLMNVAFIFNAVHRTATAKPEPRGPLIESKHRRGGHQPYAGLVPDTTSTGEGPGEVGSALREPRPPGPAEEAGESDLAELRRPAPAEGASAGEPAAGPSQSGDGEGERSGGEPTAVSAKGGGAGGTDGRVLEQEEALALVPGPPDEGQENRTDAAMREAARKYKAEHGEVLGKVTWTQGLKVWPHARKGAPRILCMVPCFKERIVDARAVAETWGAKCDRLVLLADFDDAAMGAVKVDAQFSGTESLISKIGIGWELVHERHGEDYDWFVKADTDSLIIVENLRRYLLEETPQTDHDFVPQYVGLRYKHGGFLARVFNTGAGYVVNRAALRLLNCTRSGSATCELGPVGGTRKAMWRHLPSRVSSPGCLAGWPSYDCKCTWTKRGNHEDPMTAVCLGLWGVFPRETRDQLGRQRFFVVPAQWAFAAHPPTTPWMRYYAFDVTIAGRVGEYPAVFHKYKKMKAHDLRANFERIYAPPSPA